MSAKTSTIQSISLERVLAAAAAGVCGVLTVLVWQSIGREQGLWPLPAFYFLEMAAASLVGVWGIWQANAAGSRAAWAAAGVIFGFALLASFSVGFFYLPVAGLLGLAALWQDRHTWRRLPAHIGIALLAAAAQAALILVLIRVLYPDAQF